MNYTYLSQDDDIAWYAQYGRPTQAWGYPNLKKKRAKIARKLLDRNIDLKNFNTDTSRPKNGGKFWGLGGKHYAKPNLPK